MVVRAVEVRTSLAVMVLVVLVMLAATHQSKVTQAAMESQAAHSKAAAVADHLRSVQLAQHPQEVQEPRTQ